MSGNITALIMLGKSGASNAEALVHNARRKAAIHTVQQLTQIDKIKNIIVAVPKQEKSIWEKDTCFKNSTEDVIWEIDPPDHSFHFGRRIGEIVRKHNLKHENKNINYSLNFYSIKWFSFCSKSKNDLFERDISCCS